MKLLLDTNAFIWATHEPSHLSKSATVEILNPRNERIVSMATLWEMQVKNGLGKLPLSGAVHDMCRTWLTDIGGELLPIEVRHLGTLYKLPQHHGDPFDRMLIAQAISDGLTIVSSDKALRQYNVSVIW